jgi:O-antigen/teichoic acid export membrane protein
MAVGQPHFQRRFTSLRAAIIVGLIYPAVVHFGLLGAAVVVVLGNFIALFIQVLWSRRVIDLKFSSYIRCFIPGVLLALPVLAMVSLSRLLWADSPIRVFFIGAFALSVVFLVKILVLSHTKKPNKSEKEAASKIDYLTTIGVKDA